MAAKKIETFGEVAHFVDSRADAIVLACSGGAGRVLISPRLQGRVMTSSCAGDDGPSLGWVNRGPMQELDNDPKFNNYGGEDRFWLGPEGGPYSLFFSMGAAQIMESWIVPECVGQGGFEVRNRGLDRVFLGRHVTATNARGARFTLDIDREIRLLAPAEIEELSGKLPDGVSAVAFKSTNKLTNVGKAPFKPETGLMSIWILGMFKPGKRNVVIAPYRAGGKGPALKDDYFGKVPASRLKTKSGCAAFLADGQYRAKIGLPPGRATDRLGAINFETNLLTVAQFSLPAKGRYVNSAWGLQDDPYCGDVSNSYNDGPEEPGGSSLGGFYELESSSPALELAVGKSGIHWHTTYHFQGSRAQLAALAKSILGVNIDEVEKLFF
jgi:hypothetical protein